VQLNTSGVINLKTFVVAIITIIIHKYAGGLCVCVRVKNHAKTWVKLTSRIDFEETFQFTSVCYIPTIL